MALIQNLELWNMASVLRVSHWSTSFAGYHIEWEIVAGPLPASPADNRSCAALPMILLILWSPSLGNLCPTLEINAPQFQHSLSQYHWSEHPAGCSQFCFCNVTNYYLWVCNGLGSFDFHDLFVPLCQYFFQAKANIYKQRATQELVLHGLVDDWKIHISRGEDTIW